jgi:uncharacterized protein YhdP
LVLVTFCLLLLGTLGVVFTRVVAARVPEQRATLEKLITDRTGLAVRFDNVHFAWDLDGTSAVFERVELTDPKRGRVRVVAPELRVEFDTWDYLRHHQFSLGHVTLSSPDIEIVGDPIDLPASAPTPRSGKAQHAVADDESALVRRFAAWAELMPNGRVEVEGARVHLLRRGPFTGNGTARTTFTLSQAVISRGASSFNAFGTMLLSQDVGQSLFLSAKLEGLTPGSAVSGELRVIARRVFLDKLPMIAAKGRGTLDATLRLRNGRIDSAGWQASARELELGESEHSHFDHLTVNGSLERDADDFLLKFRDLQLTRGARLERAPQLLARVSLAPGSTRIARTTVAAERVPFMAAEFFAAVFAPGLDDRLPALPGGWTASAGELHDVHFDSGPIPGSSTFSAQLTGVDLARDSDHARIAQVAARLQLDEKRLTLTFDPAQGASLRVDPASEARSFTLGGQIVVSNTQPANLHFEVFTARSDASSIEAEGSWDSDPQAQPLRLGIVNFDRALLREGSLLLAQDVEAPLLAGIERGNVVEGTLDLLPTNDVGRRIVDWQRSSGTLKLAELAISGEDLPHLAAGRGELEFARGSTRLQLDSGELDQLAVTSARLDWPRSGAPRLQAALQGDLASPLLRRVLKVQGLERLTGSVALIAEARGEKELRAPDTWRVTARVSNASIPLAGELPPIEKIAGTVRYADGQLRGLTLAGSWLGGPLTIESRRPGARGNLNVGINGVADAAPLLRLLGQDEAASLVNGQVSWTGSAQLLAAAGETTADAWQLELSSNLAGIESRLSPPFDKIRARSLPVSARIRVDNAGIREFVVDGRELAIRGVVDDGVTSAHFEVQGVTGELRRVATDAPQLKIQRLDLRRAPAVLVAAGSVLPAGGELAVDVDDMIYADRSLGGLRARMSRRESGVEFSADSVEGAPHQLTARGSCASAESRCRLEFTADTQHLATLLGGTQLPAEWPADKMHAAGELTWPIDSKGDLTRALAGRFELEAQGRDSNHQLVASATLADGQIELANVQGTGPDADQIFHGSGRVGLLAREYDLTVDFEQVSLAASAVPTPARARVARAWTVLRGSVARRGWTEVPEERRVQWHGTWEPEP